MAPTTEIARRAKDRQQVVDRVTGGRGMPAPPLRDVASAWLYTEDLLTALVKEAESAVGGAVRAASIMYASQGFVRYPNWPGGEQAQAQAHAVALQKAVNKLSGWPASRPVEVHESQPALDGQAAKVARKGQKNRRLEKLLGLPTS
jgi:hypothetical protein